MQKPCFTTKYVINKFMNNEFIMSFVGCKNIRAK